MADALNVPIKITAQAEGSVSSAANKVTSEFDKVGKKLTIIDEAIEKYSTKLVKYFASVAAASESLVAGFDKIYSAAESLNSNLVGTQRQLIAQTQGVANAFRKDITGAVITASEAVVQGNQKISASTKAETGKIISDWMATFDKQKKGEELVTAAMIKRQQEEFLNQSRNNDKRYQLEQAALSRSQAAIEPVVAKVSKAQTDISRNQYIINERMTQGMYAAERFGSTLSIAMLAGAYAVGHLLTGVVEVSAQFEQFQARLETVQKSAIQARETMQFATQFAAHAPFDVKDVIEATTKLEVFGVRSREVLPMVADLAAGMGKSVTETAQAVAKAWEGSTYGIRILRNEFGLTEARLHEFGAHLDSLGRLTLKGTENLEAFRHALMASVNVEFAGATERQAKTLTGQFSMLRDQLYLAADAMGKALLPAMKELVTIASGLVHWFTALPTYIQEMGTYALVAGTALLLLGGGLTAVAVAGVKVIEMVGTMAIGFGVVGAEMGIFAAGVTGLGTAFTFLISGVTTLAIGIAALDPLILAAIIAMTWANSVAKDKIKIDETLAKGMEEQSHDARSAEREWSNYRNILEKVAEATGKVYTDSNHAAVAIQNLEKLLNGMSGDALVAQLTKAGLSIEELQTRLGKVTDQRQSLASNISALSAHAGDTGDEDGMVHLGDTDADKKIKTMFNGAEDIPAEALHNRLHDLQKQFDDTTKSFHFLSDAFSQSQDFSNNMENLGNAAEGMKKKFDLTREVQGIENFSNEISQLHDRIDDMQAAMAGPGSGIDTSTTGMEDWVEHNQDAKDTPGYKARVDLLGLKAELRKAEASEDQQLHSDREKVVADIRLQMENEAALGNLSLHKKLEYIDQMRVAATGDAKMTAAIDQEKAVTNRAIKHREIADLEDHYSELEAVGKGGAKVHLAIIEEELKHVGNDADKKTELLKQKGHLSNQVRVEGAKAEKQSMDDSIQDSKAYLDRMKDAHKISQDEYSKGLGRIIQTIRDYQSKHKELLNSTEGKAENRDLNHKILGFETDQAKSGETGRKDTASEMEKQEKRALDASKILHKNSVDLQIQDINMWEQKWREALSQHKVDYKDATDRIEQLENEKAQLIERHLERQQQLQQQLDKGKEGELTSEIKAEEKKLDAGQDVQIQLKKDIQDRLKLQIDAIELEAERMREKGDNEVQVNEWVQQQKIATLRQTEEVLDGILSKRNELIQDPVPDFADKPYDLKKLGEDQERFGSIGKKPGGGTGPMDQIQAMRDSIKTVVDQFNTYGQSVQSNTAALQALTIVMGQIPSLPSTPNTPAHVPNVNAATVHNDNSSTDNSSTTNNYFGGNQAPHGGMSAAAALDELMKQAHLDKITSAGVASTIWRW